VGGYYRLAYSTANKSAVKYLCFFSTDAPKDLIKKLLVVDPKKRLTVSQALGHPFFQVMVNILVIVLDWHNDIWQLLIQIFSGTGLVLI
jgi:serine/threonine protein kinase